MLPADHFSLTPLSACGRICMLTDSLVWCTSVVPSSNDQSRGPYSVCSELRVD